MTGNESSELTYEMTAQADEITPPYYVRALLYRDVNRWNYPDPIGTGVSLTFSFMETKPSYYPENELFGFSSFSIAQREAVKQILEGIERVANITFTEVSDDGEGGILRFANYADPDSYIAGAAYPPSGSYGAKDGDVKINVLRVGSLEEVNPFHYHVLIHEIGHALGFNHSFAGAERLYGGEDSTRFTNMSYTRPVLPQTLQLYDIAALQYLYGAADNSSADDVYELGEDERAVQTIWDSGGTDTFDFSGRADPLRIDLSAGSFSESDTDPQNFLVAIAFGANIENAIGGSGDDNIQGSPDDNDLKGQAGDDTLDGGSGADRLDGGEGFDTAIFTGSAAGVRINLASGQSEGGAAEGDQITSIESIVGSAYADAIIGSSAENLLIGGSGDDTLVGAGGDDTLDGGAGIDTMSGGVGNDSYKVTAGDVLIEDELGGIDSVSSGTNWTLASNFENLSIVGYRFTASTGNALANVIVGSRGNNVISGKGGNDTLFGGSGNDTLDGGPGIDWLDGGSGNDVYVVNDGRNKIVERSADEPTIVSANADGVAANASSFRHQFSPDGRYVLFESDASNLVAGDSNEKSDIFLKDLLTGAVRVVSSDSEGSFGSGESVRASFSSDGTLVVFESSAANFVTGDTRGIDVFVKDLRTGSIQLVSASAVGDPANRACEGGALSPDGQWVAFYSEASNLVDGDANGVADVFLKNRQDGSIIIISSSADGLPGNGYSEAPSFSPDGKFVVFTSSASNLVSDDSNGCTDVFIKDLATGSLRLVSEAASGDQADSYSRNARFSADGRYIIFDSDASNLVAGDTNSATDVFLKDLQTGAVQCLSINQSGAVGDYWSSDAQLSADNRYCLFTSASTNLVLGDNNGASDVFVKDLQTGEVRLVSLVADSTLGNSSSTEARFSPDGKFITFLTLATNLAAGGGADTYDIVSVGNPFLLAGGGTDTVKASVSHVLAANVEILSLIGTGAVNGTGNGSANVINGNISANTLKGMGGDDTLTGGAGNDVLIGGQGNDLLVGGSGEDAFVFQDLLSEMGNTDTISDFESGLDKIRLDQDIFTRIPLGTLPHGRFVAGENLTSAQDAFDRVIYNLSDGSLFYDEDGTGPAAAVKFATLGAVTHPALSAADFVIVT